VTDTRKLIAERVEVLCAVEAAQADPHRLVDVLLAAGGDGSEAVMAAYGVSRTAAVAIVDMQFRRLTPAQRARVAEELAARRAELGEVPE
jgi:DNA gyrase/topoisomerase IV subunit A